MTHRTACLALLAALAASTAQAVPFVTAYTDGEQWNSIYAQGFSPLVNPTPDPGLDFVTPVYLDRFQFFKAGLIEGAVEVSEPVRLVILNNFFPDLTGLNAEHAAVVGVSTNSVDTASAPIGSPLTFNFDHLELDYAVNPDYAALYVTEGEGGELTPVLVPSMIADYVESEPGSGVFAPESDYGDPQLEFQYAASNFLTVNEFGTYLSAFDVPHGDASFVAYFDLPTLAGDYNNDGLVNAADYTVFRDNENQPVTLPNETVTPGTVSSEDYTEWAINFGQTLNAPYPTAPAGPATSIPEPAALGLVLLGGLSVLRGPRPAGQ